MSIIRWPLINGFVATAVAAVLLFPAGAARAVDEQVLWLPSSYIRLMPELREVARKLEEETRRCQQVMRGSLHDSSESVEQATFFLVCRDAERRTFPVLADANTLEFLEPVDPPPEPEPDPEEVQRVLAAERARRINARLDEIWQECQSLFASKTGYMRQLQRLTPGQPMPTIQGNRIRFTIDFDAESPRGEPLHFSADCQSTFVDPVIEAQEQAQAEAESSSSGAGSHTAEAAPEAAEPEAGPDPAPETAEPHPEEPTPPAPVEFRIRPRALDPEP